MKFKDVFRIGGVTQIMAGTGEYLTEGNAVVINKTKEEDNIILHLRRDSDGKEGQSRLRVLSDYQEIQESLLNWAFANDSMIGLSPEEIRFLDTNIQISSVGGKMQMALI